MNADTCENGASQRRAYFQELAICLQRAGFTLLPLDAEMLPVQWDGSPLCRISEGGSIRYRREDVDSSETETALTKATDITSTVREYMTLMGSAPPLKASGLEDGFRLLADFNGTVLAAEQTSRGVNFVTWDWSFDRTGLDHGHYYMEDYQRAKEDFALRSGLIQKERLFTQEQLVELYRAVHGYLADEHPATYQQGNQCMRLLAQIEMQVPDLEQKLAQGEQTLEQSM